MLMVVKGATMGWTSILRSSGKAQRAGRGETVINDAPYYPHPAMAFGSDAEIPEEIKRRQTALLVNYVIVLRALSPVATSMLGTPASVRAERWTTT